MTKVKICGLTNLDDALFAAQAGAAYIGLNFYRKSPRYVGVKNAAGITSKLPRSVKTVGVFVNQPDEEVRQAVKVCNLDYVQLHGDESPDFAEKLPVPVIKAFRLKDKSSLPLEGGARPPVTVAAGNVGQGLGWGCSNIYAYLFDAYSDRQFGGTGKTFDLTLLDNAIKKPFFLSGGLTPENIAEAIRRAKPFAVDVASGVEQYPGKKDPEKIKIFIEIATST